MLTGSGYAYGFRRCQTHTIFSDSRTNGFFTLTDPTSEMCVLSSLSIEWMQLLSRSHFKLEAFVVVETEKEMLSHFLTKLLESLCLSLGVGTICFALGEAFKIQTNVSHGSYLPGVDTIVASMGSLLNLKK